MKKNGSFLKIAQILGPLSEHGVAKLSKTMTIQDYENIRTNSISIPCFFINMSKTSSVFVIDSSQVIMTSVISGIVSHMYCFGTVEWCTC